MLRAFWCKVQQNAVQCASDTLPSPHGEADLAPNSLTAWGCAESSGGAAVLFPLQCCSVCLVP